MKSLDFGSLDIGGERGGSNSNVGNSDDGLRSKSNTESPFLDTGQTDDPSICPYCNKTYRKVWPKLGKHKKLETHHH